MILHTDIRGSSSREKIQTRAFTNSTNCLLIKFPKLYYDKDYDVSVTVYISSKMTRLILLPVAVLAIFYVNRLKIMITEMK